MLSFLDAPVVVGDPDGRAAYVNPAFEACFAISSEAVKGQPLAALFEGGVREAVLGAVAAVCERGTSTRFRVRHGGVGYAGIASPIEAQAARVGFVILLLENAAEHERVHSLARRVQQPTEEIARTLEELGQQAGVREKVEALVESGQRAVERLRCSSEELSALLTGHREAEDLGFEPAEVARDVARRLAEDFAGAHVQFETRIPSVLPSLPGDPARFELLLLQLLRNRLRACGDSSAVSLACGALERGGVISVVVRVVHTVATEKSGGSWAEPDEVMRLVRDLQGEVRVSEDASGGISTTVRLSAVAE